MPEIEVMSKTYKQIQIVPGAARALYEMDLEQKSHGFYMTAFTAAMLALGENATFITEAEITRVTKTAGQTWIAGDWIYWDEAASSFTNIPASDLYCVGKAQKAASNGAVLGFLALQDNYHPIQLGTNAVPVLITAGKVFDFHVTSSQAGGGNTEPFSVHTILTGATATGGRALFKVSSEVNLGGWINALKGILDLGVAGQVQGLGSGICAELVLPSGGLDRGTLACLELELVAPGALNGHPVSLIYAEITGAQAAAFNTAGYFLNFHGEAEGSGAMFDTDITGDTPTGGLRILVNGVLRHLSYI